MKQLVIEWSHKWSRDWWWRNKYKVAFNSEAHRSASQIDIYFEFVEDRLLKEAVEEFDENGKRKERLKKEGWISKSKIDKKKNIEAFNKIDLSKL